MWERSWTEEQQHRIEQAIDGEIENSRLAHKVIPEHLLSPTDRTVTNDTYIYGGGLENDRVDESCTDLNEAEQKFSLSKLQVQDAELANARIKVRRAAKQLALSHDYAVFRTTIRDRIDANQVKDGIQEIVDIGAPISEGVVTANSAAAAELNAEDCRSGCVLIVGKNI